MSIKSTYNRMIGTKSITNGVTVDLARSTCEWDNGISGDRRVELWSDELGHVWAETNGGPVAVAEDLVLLLVECGVDRDHAEAAAEGDLSWIE